MDVSRGFSHSPPREVSGYFLKIRFRITAMNWHVFGADVLLLLHGRLRSYECLIVRQWSAEWR
jgi:hypothetical protein